jgi:Zn-dependent protease with chaperone function
VTDIVRARYRFPEISPRAYEHPTDRAALVALRKIPGIDIAITKIRGLFTDRMIRMEHLATSVRTSPRQFPRPHALLRDAAIVLDLEQVPELYIHQGLGLNAYTTGMNEPIIVLSTDLLDAMNDEELRFVLGHELGHAMSGHSLYQTIASYLIRFGSMLSSVPLGTIGLQTLQLAFGEWSRKAELSSDRAGLIVSQNRDVSLHALMKLAGGAHLKQMDIEEFLAQAAEYAQAGDVRDNIIRFALIRNESHPLVAVRVGELDRWATGPDYAAVLAGHYPRRGDDSDASLTQGIRESAAGHGGAIQQSTAPVLTRMRDVGSAMKDRGRRIIDSRRPESGSQPGSPMDPTPLPSPSTDEQSLG